MKKEERKGKEPTLSCGPSLLAGQRMSDFTYVSFCIHRCRSHCVDENSAPCESFVWWAMLVNVSGRML